MDGRDCGFEVVLPFDSDDPEFARGFEAGRLWERLRHQPDAFAETVHTSNTEMVMRMADAHKRRVRGHAIADIWTTVEFDALG